MLLQRFLLCLNFELAGVYDEDANDDSLGLTWVLSPGGEWQELKLITTKDLQLILKAALKETDVQTFDLRLGIVDYDQNQINKFRN